MSHPGLAPIAAALKLPAQFPKIVDAAVEDNADLAVVGEHWLASRFAQIQNRQAAVAQRGAVPVLHAFRIGAAPRQCPDHCSDRNVEDQPPELWDQFKTEFQPGAHIRIHPLLHWTELNVWEYIEREQIPVIPLYFANGRGERYRSLGCAPCTMPIKSNASTVGEIIEELRHTKSSERSGRAQDQESEDAFEKLRRDGYM